MSEFVFVIPAGWTKVSDSFIPETGSIVGDWVNMNDMVSLSDALKARSEIPQDVMLIEARLFNGEVLVVRVG